MLDVSSPKVRGEERRAAILNVKRDTLPVRYWHTLVSLFILEDLARNNQAIAKIRQYASTHDLTGNSKLESIASIQGYVNSLGPAVNDT